MAAAAADVRSSMVLPRGAPAPEQLQRLLWLLEDEQLLEAQRQLVQLRQEPDVASLSGELASLSTRLEYLERQAEEVESAKADFEGDSGGRVRVMRLFGVSTFYKVKEGERAIWVKMEGEMENLSVLQLAAVIREIDLFKTWMPFCSFSEVLRWYSRANVLAHLAIALPLFYRDAVLHAYACDTTGEDGSFLILGRSVDEDGTDAGGSGGGGGGGGGEGGGG